MRRIAHDKTLIFLVIFIGIATAAATLTGIFSGGGPGSYSYESIRGETVTIYGKGIYRHMSAEVAPQGIAQDYVTLLVGIPLLFISLVWSRRGSLRGRYLLAGTLGYFLVTYLFYLMMGMYNALFLVYAALLSASFFAFSIVFQSFDTDRLPNYFHSSTPVKITGGYLVFNSLIIALLWLSIVVPPLLDGTIIPEQTEHYTTLVVQGLDLALLLPLGVVAGILFIRKLAMGYLLAPIYFVFLSILMTALSAKVIAMALLDYNVIPVIFIIPTFNILVLTCTFWILKYIGD